MYECTEFKHDEKGRLYEEREFDGNSELIGVKSYTYNQKGFKSNVTENFFHPNEKRVYKYEYEYWENDK
jgi:hypothetical protein